MSFWTACEIVAILLLVVTWSRSGQGPDAQRSELQRRPAKRRRANRARRSDRVEHLGPLATGGDQLMPADRRRSGERSISPQAHAGIHGDTRSRPCSTHTRARRSRTQHHSRTARARRPADDTWTQGQHSGHLPHGGASLTRSAQIPALSLEVGTSRRASRGRPGSPGSCGRGAAGRAWQGGRRLVPKSPAGPAQRSICCCL